MEYKKRLIKYWHFQINILNKREIYKTYSSQNSKSIISLLKNIYFMLRTNNYETDVF